MKFFGYTTSQTDHACFSEFPYPFFRVGSFSITKCRDSFVIYERTSMAVINFSLLISAIGHTSVRLL